MFSLKCFFLCLQLDKRVVPSSADVVVIGGGSLGCSALYHLTKHGVTNAVLLEANKLTAGKVSLLYCMNKILIRYIHSIRIIGS